MEKDAGDRVLLVLVMVAVPGSLFPVRRRGEENEHEADTTPLLGTF
jgi:hypothetical protein